MSTNTTGRLYMGLNVSPTGHILEIHSRIPQCKYIVAIYQTGIRAYRAMYIFDLGWLSLASVICKWTLISCVKPFAFAYDLISCCMPS